MQRSREMLLELLSFLHRYVPVGLLERPDVLLTDNKRPFSGRDALETLFASPRVEDWRQIACMLLGPEPDDFSYVPRHNSQSYSEENG